MLKWIVKEYGVMVCLLDSLAQDRVWWLARVDSAMTFRVP